MMIPAIEAEKTDTNTKLEGSNPWITRNIVPVPRAKAKIKNAAIGYLIIKFGCDALFEFIS